MFSLLRLVCGREGVVNPDGDSKAGAEMRMRGRGWQHGGGGGGRGPRDEIGGWDRVADGGLGGVTVRTGVAISKISTRGSVWIETEV